MKSTVRFTVGAVVLAAVTAAIATVVLFAGDLVESVTLVDDFSSEQRRSLCYRVCYRHSDRTLTNDEVNAVQASVVEHLREAFDVEIRG